MEFQAQRQPESCDHEKRLDYCIVQNMNYQEWCWMEQTLDVPFCGWVTGSMVKWPFVWKLVYGTLDLFSLTTLINPCRQTFSIVCFSYTFGPAYLCKISNRIHLYCLFCCLAECYYNCKANFIPCLIKDKAANVIYDGRSASISLFLWLSAP